MATVSPTQDCYVIQATPTTNYNTSEYSVLGTSGALRQAFMEFAIPSNPVGQVIDSVSLRITTSSTGGSVNTFTFREMLDASMDETTMTWNTGRPTSEGDALGTLANPSATNTEHNVTLDAAVIAEYVGDSIIIRIGQESGGTDSVWFWSASTGVSESLRPLMTIDYVASATDHTATPGDALGMTDIAAAAKTTIWPVTREIQIG